MNELSAILQLFEESQQKDETAYLATIINTQGSTYRRSGAKMLMTSTGRMVGAISGGCLENDIFEHTRQQLQSGQPIVVTYDTTDSEDLVWGFGIGCNGVVQVLIERLDRLLNPLVFLQACLKKRQPGVIATVFSVEGLVEMEIGARVMLADDGAISTNIESPNFLPTLVSDIKASFQTLNSSIHQYQLPSGSVKVFIEVIQPPTPLIIFGAGSDAIPVANFAQALGWNVTVVDCRASEATGDRFSLADQVILTRRDIIDRQVLVEANTAAVVMTHNYFDDLEILKMLLPSPAQYIGVLGAKKRTEGLLNKLIYTKDQLERLYFPIGIDLGAETPQEIALAIVAEVQAVLSHRAAGFLKHRPAPIHRLPLSI
jgi:xanthine/CO dehydrogenase XdhC/CoxF family maturation factor